MDDTMAVEKADIEDIDSLVELRLDYLVEDNPILFTERVGSGLKPHRSLTF